MLADTPAPPSTSALNRERYAITDLLNDFRDDRPREDLVAIACLLYPQVGNFVLRSRGRWLGSGKTLPRLVRLAAPDVSSSLEQGFDTFFRCGERAQAIAAVQRVLEPLGGEIFEGYRADAPADWRVPRAAVSWVNDAESREVST